MTDEYTSRRTAEADWVVAGRYRSGSYPRLHAPGEWHDPNSNMYTKGKTACGIKTLLAIPGMFTRMNAERCKHCCRITGMPEGSGSPKNGDGKCQSIAGKRAELFAPNIIFADPRNFDD